MRLAKSQNDMLGQSETNGTMIDDYPSSFLGRAVCLSSPPFILILLMQQMNKATDAKGRIVARTILSGQSRKRVPPRKTDPSLY
jgi:hypothetical protein